MQLKRWTGCLLALAFGTAAQAGGLTVKLLDQHGNPVADAVVTLLPQHIEPAPAHQAQIKSIDQKNLTFIPYLEIFRPGDSVVFRNSDSTRHHVYSFSQAGAFEFMLAPGESSAPLVLDKTGVIAVGCNIHDQMIAYLYVSSAPWLAHSGADGTVSFQDLPPGTYSVQVWQPRLRPDRSGPVRTVGVTAASTQTLSFDLALLPDSRQQYDSEHLSY